MNYKKENILGGQSPTKYLSTKTQYQSSIAIDPDFPLTDSGKLTSGVLRPVAYSKFSGENIDANPYWFITNPKDTNVYAYTANGKIVSYNSSLASETPVGTATSSTGNGAVYYNNYIYFMKNEEVARYGPLNDVSKALTQGWWTGEGLGALTPTTYPSIRGAGTVPNHAGHVMPDNKLYFCDYKDGVGMIHYIKTSKTTVEGDTDDGSSYNALDLPFGFKPVCLGEYEDNLVIGAIQTSSNSINQGKSYLFFWDTVSDSFYRQVAVPEPFITSIKNVNGSLLFFAGKLSTGGGYSLYQYLGGTAVKSISTFGEGHPPLQGAVDAVSRKLVWGSWVTDPDNAACVWSYGSKDDRLPSAIHNIAKSTSVATATDGVITALMFAEQGSNALPQMIMGWRSSTAYGIDKLSTTYQTSYFRDRVVSLDKPFRINRIQLLLGTTLAANMTITPKFYFDDDSSSSTLTTINSTNNSGRRISIYPQDCKGENNFYLELKWSGTALCPVLLPIIIDYEERDVGNI